MAVKPFIGLHARLLPGTSSGINAWEGAEEELQETQLAGMALDASTGLNPELVARQAVVAAQAKVLKAERVAAEADKVALRAAQELVAARQAALSAARVTLVADEAALKADAEVLAARQAALSAARAALEADEATVKVDAEVLAARKAALASARAALEAEQAKQADLLGGAKQPASLHNQQNENAAANAATGVPAGVSGASS